MELPNEGKKEQVEQPHVGGEGNTKDLPPGKKGQGTQKNYWCFTWNNFSEQDLMNLIELMKLECGWYLFQEEQGTEGTLHLQGTLYLKQRRRLSELKKWSNKIHWEPTKAITASMAYCSKKETRVGRIFTHGIKIETEEIEVDKPYGWQLEVMSIIAEKPDKRSIYWFWSKKGGVGKSSLSKYLAVKNNALIISGVSRNDANHLVAKFKDRRKIIVFDVPKSSAGFINYGTIEKIKDGMVISGKYDSDMVLFNSPHVICFSNEEPDYEEMSRDRWKVKQIDL